MIKQADIFIERDAVISDCGKYRYLLRRTWDYTLQRALFIMLNPSTADASIDDPTIRSCTRLCKSWGYGSFEVVNLFAYRSTDPDALLFLPMVVRCGPQCESVMSAAIERCDIVIAAWGAHKSAERRWPDVKAKILAAKPACYCLGKNKNGSPRHPLYVKTGTFPQVLS